ncbi:MAG: hypothetical protein Q9227_000105 [Pyrenula ochraceoflavens]
MLDFDGTRLTYRYDAEKLWIEPWGANALRIQATMQSSMPSESWALERPTTFESKFSRGLKSASISNGKITATVTTGGKLTIHDSANRLILEEYSRHRKDVLDPKTSALNVAAREFRPLPGNEKYHTTLRLETVDANEKLYGMGQYQQRHLNLSGHDLELAHRNSQASIPFLLSSRGYGFLWNNPSVGRAVLGKNIHTFEAFSTDKLDYWIIVGDNPSEIVEGYAAVTGKVPMMPDYGLGFWQCKLRYQTQEELLSVAREYHRRKLKVDVIVADFFHWPLQGEWKFDKTYWPDPDAMIQELKSMGMELMVSVWPTVDKRSDNYEEMLEKGLLIRTDRGVRTAMTFMGDTVHFDATNPDARTYVWQKAKQNYYSKGVKIFWLDEAEPEYDVYDFDIYRYHAGSNLSIGNIYPRDYARAFYEGMTAAGQSNVVNLLRCAWAGSQKYGALVWSGDIASSWGSLRNQLAAGLNMGLAGIPWWTTDIGGFHGGDPNDEAFRELFVRWFQWGAFCPVMRLHGDREPKQPQQGTTGGAECLSGAPNEIWSYGEKVEGICVKYMNIREGMRDYIRGLMREAHEKGTPVIRTLFYEFPKDARCWEVEDQYFFGDRYLVAPILAPEQKKREVYLPKGASWKIFDGDNKWHGGQTIEMDCPLETMPVLVRS